MQCFAKIQKENFNLTLLEQFRGFDIFEFEKDKWISWEENGGLERFNRYVNMTNYNDIILNKKRNLTITGTKERVAPSMTNRAGNSSEFVGIRRSSSEFV